MERLFTLLFTANTVSAFISITVQNSTLENGETVMGIDCDVDVNGTQIASVISIQLKKSSKNIASIADGKGIVWQDRELESRSGVSVNASISNASSAYLHLNMLSSAIRYPEDAGNYQCSLSAFGAQNDLITSESRIISANLTGFKKQSDHDVSSLGTSLRLPAVGCLVLTVLLQTF